MTYGQGLVDGRKAFGINWTNVGYFWKATNKLNSFQLVIIDRSCTFESGDFDVEFNYNQILWEEGIDSGGIDGYGNTPARVGITNGIDRTIEDEYSGRLLKNWTLPRQQVHHQL